MSPTKSDTERHLTPKNVADQLGLHHRTVLSLIDSGAFPNAINLGGSGRGRRYRIPKADVARFLASRRVDQPT